MAEARMGLTFEPEAPPLKVDEYGVVRVTGMRLTLDTVLHAYQRGEAVDDILDAFPDLSRADVHAIIAYYLRHQDDVDAYLLKRERRAAEVQTENERRFPP